MREDNWQRIRAFAALMDEVDSQAVDLGTKLCKLIELHLLCSPIEIILPVIYQALEIA